MNFSHPIRRGAAIAATLLISVILAAGCTAQAAPPKPSLAPLTEVERIQLYASEADRLWAGVAAEFSSAQRPSDIKVVRAVSDDERPRVLAECLTAAGYPAKVSPAGDAFDVEVVPEGQKQSFAVSSFVCRASYPYEAEINRPPSDEQLVWLYHYWTTDLSKCIRDKGYEPTGNPPSQSAFLDGVKGLNDAVWSPYLDMTTPGGSELMELHGICPEFPDAYYGR